MNECALNPCKNGAACTDLVNDYNCSCIGSWKGKNCDWITGEVLFVYLLKRKLFRKHTLQIAIHQPRSSSLLSSRADLLYDKKILVDPVHPSLYIVCQRNT